MSIQLILQPQNVQGFTSSIGSVQGQVLPDNVNFASLANAQQSNIILNNVVLDIFTNYQAFNQNIWYSFKQDTSAGFPALNSGDVTFNLSPAGTLSGIYMTMFTLITGQVYTVQIQCNPEPSSFTTFLFAHSPLGSNSYNETAFIPLGSGVYETTFTAGSPQETLLFSSFLASGTGTATITQITVIGATQTFNIINGDGQVICDLYEDEDLPLTLSVDDFKNVAEKVQSYSKTFNLPGTKRNNKIFDALYEITRSYDGVIFSPYKRTQCVLKQDGFILFQGFLRLLDITDKLGEISYNVNLYSEVTALAEVLNDRTFQNLDFTELEHLYNFNNIEDSYNDNGTGIAYTNTSTSGFRDANSTVKYPFVDWNHSLTLSATNQPVMPNLESGFRPWINVKYLIDRIFNSPNTPFTYESTFLNTTEFARLYMDFNWGSNANPNNSTQAGSGIYSSSSFNNLQPPIFASTTFSNMQIGDNSIPANAGYSTSNFKFTVPTGQTNQLYELYYNLNIWAVKDDTVEFQILQVKDGISSIIGPQQIPLIGSAMVHFSTFINEITNVTVINGGYYPGGAPTITIDSSQGNGATFTVNMLGDTIDSIDVDNGGSGYLFWDKFIFDGVTQGQANGLISGYDITTLNPGDTLEFQFKASNFSDSIIQSNETTPLNGGSQTTGHLVVTISNTGLTSNILLQTLRGELGQWEFLKGLITMFNLVTLPDEDNPTNIIIEPYSDIFVTPALTSTPLDWTEKVDASQMVLKPLTDLNKTTIFKFVEDDDDYPFQNYKSSVNGFLYGSQEYSAGPDFNILDGIDEVEAAPFGATVIKPYMQQFGDFITPSIYSFSESDNTTEGFENSPRILYNVGQKYMSSTDLTVPDQNDVTGGITSFYLQFSHTSSVPVNSDSVDFNFGICQLLISGTTPQNLFNLYWLPYYNQLYNPDTRIMTLKVNLTPSDINIFKFNSTVIIKNRTFRVNKIDYKPNDLATVEFILIP